MQPEASDITLRRCVFAVSVLRDVDLVPLDDGVVLAGVPTVHVSWAELRLALGAADAESGPGQDRVARWLILRRWLADRHQSELRECVRPVGLPVGHALHPGPGWPQERVLGDAMDLGLGIVGSDPANPDEVVVLPTELLRAAGVSPRLCWHDARRYLDRMAALAIQRWNTSARDILRPMGDCDVVTLIGSPALRAALCSESGGMRTVVVPMRTRGWVDPSHIDPAFAMAAAAASQPADRGFERGLLVTADEVVMVPAGGRPQELALRGPAIDRPQHLRPVLYHR
ncbi:MAG: hypothetical protein QOG49_489 [Frankiaceae bacterium]|nr:hypothetical protein [Frankiaceae bacterium]